MSSCKPIKSRNEITSEWLEEILKKYYKNSMKVEKFQFSNSFISDGFLSDIAFCDVFLQGSPQTLSLVIKMLPSNDEMKDILLEIKVAQVEADFNHFLMSDNFQEFVQKMAVRVPIPQIFYSNLIGDSLTLVMENMVSKGYFSVLDPAGIDLQTTLKAVRAIARFHSTMFAYFTKHPKNDMMMSIKKAEKKIQMIENCLYSGLKKVLEVTANEEVCTKINNLLSSGKYKKLIDKHNSSVPLTFIHGDYWTGQVLYSKDDACILDWQFVDYDDPLNDIATFLFMSCNSSMFANLDAIVGTYLDSLNGTLKKFELSMQLSYQQTLESLDLSWRKGFAVLISSIETFLNENRISLETLEGHLVFSLKKGFLDID